MKKNILISLLSLCLILLPMTVKAEQYDVLNLHEALKQEEIAHDFSNYKENANTINNDNKATIYLFRGNGCTVCRSFLSYLNSITETYGDKFQLVSFEVWNNSDNSALLKKVAEFLDVEVGGVPYIVIGNQVFNGYAASLNTSIEDAIEKQYASETKYDVFKEMGMTIEDATEAEVYPVAKKESSMSNGTVVLLNLLFTIISTATIAAIIMVTYNKLDQKINAIDKKQKKGNSKND